MRSLLISKGTFAVHNPLKVRDDTSPSGVQSFDGNGDGLGASPIFNVDP